MEALRILKSRRYTRAGAVVSSDERLNGSGKTNEGVQNPVFCADDEETDDEESFFDLVIKSPDSVAVEGGEEASKKDFQFIESPRDVFLSKNDFSAGSIPKSLSAVPVLRSPPKFKVFMLGFKKSSKCEKTESNAELKTSPLNQFSKLLKIEQSNRFSVKCRAEELPVATVFARDNSLRSKMLKESSDYDYETSSDVVSPEKSPKDSIPKYLKLIKPLYGKVTKRQHEKAAKITSSWTPLSSPVTAPLNLSPRKSADGSRVGSFKIVARHLGKSRSASAAQPPLRRRDDSLLEQHDGIQGAILHCKKSYNSSSIEFSQLFRSISDPLHENSGRNSYEEQKRRSI